MFGLLFFESGRFSKHSIECLWKTIIKQFQSFILRTVLVLTLQNDNRTTRIFFIKPPNQFENLLYQLMNYVVERIVDKKTDRKSKRPLYFVKWEGFDSSQNTWEPIKHLRQYCSSLIEDFQRQRLADHTQVSRSNGEGTENPIRRPSNKKQNRRIRKQNKTKFSVRRKKNSVIYCESSGEDDSEVSSQQQSSQELEIADKLQNQKIPSRPNNPKEEQMQKQSSNLQKTKEYQPIIQQKQAAENDNPMIDQQQPQKQKQQNRKSFSPYFRTTNTTATSQNLLNLQNNKFKPVIVGGESQKNPIFGSLKQDQKNQDRSERKEQGQDNLTKFFNNINKLQLDNHSLQTDRKKENRVGQQNFESNKRQVLEVLGLRRLDGKLVFYVQSTQGRSWKTHEFMLSNHVKQLCEFYEKHLDFQ